MAEPETPKSLRSLLHTDERDIFLIRNNGEQVPISELEGKMVGLYFAADWCPACPSFTRKLIKVYNELRENGEDFEIVFLSSDRSLYGFKKHQASMPWLALPFEDKLNKDISEYFENKGIPSLIIVGPDGETVTKDGSTIVTLHGAKAYPFTSAWVAKLEKELEAAVEKYPKDLKHGLHKHTLELARRPHYMCNGCREFGYSWSFYCQGCDFDLHPDCAFKDSDDKESDENKNQYVMIRGCRSWVREGDVCRRV